jgi:hypothetical protein
MRSAANTTEALQRIVKGGCPEPELKEALARISTVAALARKEPPLGAVKHEGKLKKALKDSLKSLKRAAEDLAPLQSEPGGSLFPPSLRYCQDAMRRLIFEEAVLLQSGGWRPRRELAISSLTELVHRYTGRWLDVEVSMLTGEALGEDYPPESHIMWRRRQRLLLAWVKVSETDHAMVGLRMASVGRRQALTSRPSTSCSPRSDVVEQAPAIGGATSTTRKPRVTRTRRKSPQESD